MKATEFIAVPVSVAGDFEARRALGVYVAVKSIAGHERRGRCVASYGEIAAVAGVSARTVGDHVRTLVERGHLQLARETSGDGGSATVLSWEPIKSNRRTAANHEVEAEVEAEAEAEAANIAMLTYSKKDKDKEQRAETPLKTPPVWTDSNAAEALIAEHGDRWAKRYPELDGRDGRMSLLASIENTIDWQLEQPIAKRKKTMLRTVENSLRRHHGWAVDSVKLQQRAVKALNCLEANALEIGELNA